MSRRTLATLGFLIVFITCAPQKAISDSATLPLPRFVSLRAEEANMRTGPGEQYPIKWTYQRPGLPLEVVAEFHHWRRVRDWQGAEGWMHSSMLSGKRYAMVISGTRNMREKADPTTAALAQVETRVIGRLIECPAATDWCLLEIGRLKGWLQRKDLWGVYPTEIVE